MEELNQIKSFPITVYGDLEKFTEVTSKARCRIFYKGANRNGSYITDEFAETLLKTIPYTPVKGIYDEDDYTDHGYSRSLGRIYGIVPENPNVTWEKHVDEDGIEREYACVDVLLFTALYAEAGDIVGKSQSMELYDKSIQGEWMMYEGKKCFQFTEGCFLGLQVLGSEVEPCFEGAAFFTLYESLSEMLKKIEEYNLNFSYKKQGGTNKMPAVNFKLSDNQKYDAIWNLLNPNYSDETYEGYEYCVLDVYDEYAIARKCGTNSYERVYYRKREEDNDDFVEIMEKKKCYIIDVSEEEMAALNALKCINNGTYEKLDENFNALNTKVEELTQENENFGHKIEEYTSNISTLEIERDNIKTQFEAANQLVEESKVALEAAQNSLSALQTEYDSLTEYKRNVELAEKEAVIATYTDLLSDEVITSFREKINDYTAEELDMRMTYALKKSNPNIFGKNNQSNPLPKDNQSRSGIEEILSKYVK